MDVLPRAEAHRSLGKTGGPGWGFGGDGPTRGRDLGRDLPVVLQAAKRRRAGQLRPFVRPSYLQCHGQPGRRPRSTAAPRSPTLYSCRPTPLYLPVKTVGIVFSGSPLLPSRV